jgi:hypothetical protein
VVASGPLSTEQIAGVVVGVLIGILMLLLLAFFFVRFLKKREQKKLERGHPEMAAGGVGAMAAAAVGARSASDGSRRAGNGYEMSSQGGPPGEVRIVIQQPPKRRTQSSGAFPPQGVEDDGVIPGESAAGVSANAWPRPPGYSGRPYSFFVEESGDTTPQDPQQWSNASEFGSTSGAHSRSAGGYGPGSAI